MQLTELYGAYYLLLIA